VRAVSDPTGVAGRSLVAGLEAPLRVRAAAGVDVSELLERIQANPGLAFDQTRPGLVPAVSEGPIDAVRVVDFAIREAGKAAADLLRMG
jgi:hypothetical protein